MKTQEQIIEIVNEHLTAFRAELKKANAKLEENFIMNFEWGWCEIKFSLLHKIECLESFLNYIEQTKDKETTVLPETTFIVTNEKTSFEKVWLDHHIETITTILLEGTIYRKTSTVTVDRASELRVTANREMLKIYKELNK